MTQETREALMEAAGTLDPICPMMMKKLREVVDLAWEYSRLLRDMQTAGDFIERPQNIPITVRQATSEAPCHCGTCFHFDTIDGYCPVKSSFRNPFVRTCNFFRDIRIPQT